MILALVTVAAATSPTPCGTPELLATSPEDGATGVPIDVIPVTLPPEGGCEYVEWIATLLVADTGETVVTLGNYDDGDQRLFEIDPGGELLPDTRYTIKLESTAGAEPALEEISFTTGSARTVGLGTAPAVTSGLLVLEQPNWLRIQAEIDVAVAAEGASVVAFGIEGGDDLAYTLATGPTTLQLVGHSRAYEETPEEVCVTARQRDLAGRWTESEVTCLTPVYAEDAGCGCDSPGAPAGLVGVLLAAALARRARR